MDCLQGGIVQPRYVRLGRFVLAQEDAMATDLVMPDCQQVTGSQAGAVSDQDPRRQQQGVVAGPRATLHGPCGGHPLGDLLMAQGHRARFGHLDAPQGAKYTLVHVALVRCVAHQCPQHSAMVGYGGGSQMSQGIVQVGVDLVRRQVGRAPGQPFTQHGELLGVSPTAPDTPAIGQCELGKRHGVYSQRRGDYSAAGGSSRATHTRYNRTKRAASSVVSLPIRRLFLWLALRRWPILRAVWLALLVAGLVLHRIEGVLALLVLGQFRQAWIDLMDRCAPRTGLSLGEVNR